MVAPNKTSLLLLYYYYIDFSDAAINRESDSTLSLVNAIGDDVTLPCNVSANPQPTYAWYKDQTILAEQTAPQLTIDRVTEVHFGEYTCSVTNTVGTVAFQISLNRRPGK